VTYDSRPDTEAHIQRVRSLLTEAVHNLIRRGGVHDQSKLESPEKEMFDEFTPRLRAMTYGSDEYKACLTEMRQTALAHHYAHNSHHPEHYENSFDGMSLLDVLEMLCDWKAAGERHADGSLAKSLEINRERFGLSPQLHAILVNTARELGWL
jgi:hypothetical protein